MNEIFNEDCYKTVTKRDIGYDYVCFSPPDYDELGWTPIVDDKKYIKWQKRIYKNLKPRNGVVTIVTSLRMFKRLTIPKDVHVYHIMSELGYKLLTKKVWVKPSRDKLFYDPVNLYRYDNAIVQSFGFGDFKSKGTKRYRVDNWTEDYKMEKFDDVKYTYHYPETMINRCIENFTDEGEVVYDPFIGIGTTAIASYNMNRNYYGSEIDKKIYRIAVNRTENLKKIKEKA